MKKEEILRQLETPQWEELVREELAADPAKERTRCRELLQKSCELYGDGEYALFSAPGRSEIIGNHTDHQHGHVIGASVNIDTIAFAKKNGDGIVRFTSLGFDLQDVDLSDLSVHEGEKNRTESLIRGIAGALKERGYAYGGFDGCAVSAVRAGSGISSSASFEVLITEIFNHFYNDGKISAKEVAQISQRAENHWFGKPCGLLDQMAIACGGFTFMDFSDPADPQVRSYDFSFADHGYSLVLTASKSDHSDLSDEYAAMPLEMKEVAAALGKTFLSECSEEEFYAKLPQLQEELHNDRALLRAIHYFGEDARALAAREAIERGDIDSLLEQMKEGGLSSYRFLQNAFSLKHPENQIYALTIALSEKLLQGRGITRVHGGGLAGTIQAIVPDEMVEDYCRGMEAFCGEGSSSVMAIRKAGGIRIL